MTQVPWFSDDDADDPIVDYSKRLRIDPPLTCTAELLTDEGRRVVCGKPAPIGRIWPEEDAYLLRPQCEACDAEYERAYADRQPSEQE